jgi:hypothetical protein
LKHLILFSAGLLINTFLSAQIDVKQSIIMTGSSYEERQVKGLSDPLTETCAVNAKIIQYGKLIFASVAGNPDSIALTLPVPPDSYTPGMLVNFISTGVNTRSVLANLNNLGPVQIMKNVNQPLDSAEIIPGQVVVIIYDGIFFQVLSELNKPCPSGFIEISPNYCIESRERGPLSFWQAAKECGDLGGKLCDWAEWYYACQDSVLAPQLQNMTGNWEWMDMGGNNSTGASHSNNTVQVVGLNSCTDRSTGAIVNSSGVTQLRYFHCCFKKR